MRRLLQAPFSETRREAEARLHERTYLLSKSLEGLLRAEDPNTVVRELFPRIAAHLGVDAFLNFMLNTEGDALTLHSCEGIPEEMAQSLARLEFGQGICGTAAGTREPMIVSDLQRSDCGKAALARQHRFQAYVCNPLLVGERLLGTLSFASRSRTHFTTDELEFMRLITQYTAIAIDRLRTAKALKESEFRYRTLFNSMEEGFCVIEVLFDEKQKAIDYRFLEINPAFEKQTGLKDAKGKRMRELAPEHEDHWFQIYGKIALTGESARFDNRAEALGRWYDVYAFRVEAPELRRVAIVFNDVTERRKAHELLEQTVERRTGELRETIHQLETFSYSVVHDMRAPLRAMNSYADILIHEYGANLDSEGQEYLRRILNGSQRLDRLIQDILQYNRVARGDLPMEDVSFGRVLREVIEQYPQIGEQKQHVRIESKCDNARVRANVAALTQIVANLLTNALKFVPPNRCPDVRVSCEPCGQNIRLLVHDNGIGIEPEFHDVIFGIFRRLHNAEYPGTGVGLSIVKKAVERMGGALGLESAKNEGSIFWIELRRACDVECCDRL